MKKRPLARNVGALLVVQASNYLLPLLVIPYLARVLGPELFGVVAFGTAMVAVCCLFTDFGFNLSATYALSRASGDPARQREIASAVLICKLGLLIAVALAAGLLIHFNNKYSEHRNFLFLMMLAVAGQTFQAVWFFQGLERMSYITLYAVAGRILYVVLVVTLVKERDDYILVAASLAVSNAISAVASFILMAKLGYRMSRPRSGELRRVFSDSLEFFWGRAAVASYSSGASFLLGLVASPVQLAHYAASEQIYKGGQSAFLPVTQALYPTMARTRDIHMFSRVFRVCACLALVGVMIGVCAGDWIIGILLGSEFSDSTPVLMVFMATLALSVPSMLLGYPLLAAVGLLKYANRSVLIGGAVQLTLLSLAVAVGQASAITVACAVLGAEASVLLFRLYYVSTKAGISPKALLFGRAPENQNDADAP